MPATRKPMEMARFRRHLPKCFEESGKELAGQFRSTSGQEKRAVLNFWVVLLIVVVGFLLLPPILSWTFRFTSGRLSGYRDGVTLLHAADSKDLPLEVVGSEEDDPYLGGLLSDDIDNVLCQSRGVIHRFRQVSKYKPSPQLVTRLREYEDLHRKCAPGTEYFNKSLQNFDRRQGKEVTECNYVIWIAYSGLGNRLVSIAATFVYALLTNRVLLLDGRADIGDLFCEPFPGTTWLLPSDFSPLHSYIFNETSPQRFGNLLKMGGSVMSESRSVSFPGSTYVHLTHTYDFHDKLFFCEKEQGILNMTPWLFLRTNQYFVPSLYIFIPHFRDELDRLFPQRETVFHHIGRYLFYPTNSIWSWILRFHGAYLASAKGRLGYQIRTFDFPYTSDQILACAIQRKVLPNITDFEGGSSNPVFDTEVGDRRPMSVLVTSLKQNYFEKMRDFYLEHATVTGDLVSVYQPSHEQVQQTDRGNHNKKAWAEICLLSFSDNLITSASSTFGYAAQGLSGIVPWILTQPENNTMPEPACSQARSIEPCFHAPPYYNCMTGRGTDTTKFLPYVKHCEDVAWGLKLFTDHDDL